MNGPGRGSRIPSARSGGTVPVLLRARADDDDDNPIRHTPTVFSYMEIPGHCPALLLRRSSRTRAATLLRAFARWGSCINFPETLSGLRRAWLIGKIGKRPTTSVMIIKTRVHYIIRVWSVGGATPNDGINSVLIVRVRGQSRSHPEKIERESGTGRVLRFTWVHGR